MKTATAVPFKKLIFPSPLGEKVPDRADEGVIGWHGFERMGYFVFWLSKNILTCPCQTGLSIRFNQD